MLPETPDERDRAAQAMTFPVADGVDDVTAAAIGTSGFTAFMVLERAAAAGARLDGAHVLVLAGTGVVGSCLTQLARAAGRRACRRRRPQPRPPGAGAGARRRRDRRARGRARRRRADASASTTPPPAASTSCVEPLWGEPARAAIEALSAERRARQLRPRQLADGRADVAAAPQPPRHARRPLGRLDDRGRSVARRSSSVHALAAAGRARRRRRRADARRAAPTAGERLGASAGAKLVVRLRPLAGGSASVVVRSCAVTVVTGSPSAATLLGRSSLSQRDTRAGSVERITSSKPCTLMASWIAFIGDGSPTIAPTLPPDRLLEQRDRQRDDLRRLALLLVLGVDERVETVGRVRHQQREGRRSPAPPGRAPPRAARAWPRSCGRRRGRGLARRTACRGSFPGAGLAPDATLPTNHLEFKPLEQAVCPNSPPATALVDDVIRAAAHLEPELEEALAEHGLTRPSFLVLLALHERRGRARSPSATSWPASSARAGR